VFLRALRIIVIWVLYGGSLLAEKHWFGRAKPKHNDTNSDMMFDENFTFGAPRSPSLDSSKSSSTRDTSRAVSPCSPTGPFPPPSFSVTDLAAQFAGSRLRRDAQICYDSCVAYANNDDDAGWSVEPSIEDADLASTSRSRASPQRLSNSHSPSQRSRRQANAGLLCSSSHRHDIAALVARMVDSNEQCSISPSQDTISSTAALEDDEGYNSSDGFSPIQTRRSSLAPIKQRSEYRRSSDMKTTGACVSKSARFRRDKGHLRKRSSE